MLTVNYGSKMSGLVAWRGTSVNDMSVRGPWIEKIGWEARGLVLEDDLAFEICRRFGKVCRRMNSEKIRDVRIHVYRLWLGCKLVQGGSGGEERKSRGENCIQRSLDGIHPDPARMEGAPIWYVLARSGEIDMRSKLLDRGKAASKPTFGQLSTESGFVFCRRKCQSVLFRRRNAFLRQQ